MGIKMGTPPKQQASDANLTIQNASYSGVSFDVSGQATGPRGIFFNDGGTKMFIVGASSDSVHQYSLTTGFDLSTATYDSVSFDISGQDGTPTGIFFNSGGTKMFMSGNTNNNVYQYSLTTGFDISTASYDNISFNVSAQDGSPTDIIFNSTGTKMFMVGSANDTVYQYTLGTGFDLSTAAYDSVSFDVSSQLTVPSGIFFNSTGTRMIIIGFGNDLVYQYSLGTGFDLSTAAYDSVSFDVSGQGGGPTGISFNPAGTKMFMVDRSSDSIYQYDL